MRLAEKTAIVTGGSSGVGRGIALKLAEEGAAVAVGDLREAPKQGVYYDVDLETPTHEVIQAKGGSAAFKETDVADPDQCKALVDHAVDEFGRLDILVNNAGIHVPGDAEEISLEDYHRVVDVNLNGQFYCVKFALPALKETEGSIVNIGSVHAMDGGAGPPYTAAKAGVVNFTKDLATHFGDDNVNANAVCPGFIETPMQDYLTEEDIEGAREHTSLPRFGTPEDIGNAVAFLASDEADWITGEALYVDGGWTAHR